MKPKKRKKMDNEKKPDKPHGKPQDETVLTNPEPNTLEWTLPVMEKGSVLIYTYINYASPDHNYLENGGGVRIEQFGLETPVTKYVNKMGGVVGEIPAGVWNVLVTNYAAQEVEGGYASNDVDDPYLTNWLDGINFD